MDLFVYLDYKEYIRDRLTDGSRGMHSTLARAAGCQSSFLSHVLNGPVHLTPDHAAAMALHWKLDALATDYFIHLVMYARAASPVLVQHLRIRLNEIKTSHQDLSRRFAKSERLTQEAWQVLYYGSWYYSAIHIALKLPALRQPKSIAERLHLPVTLVEKVLRELAEMGLAHVKKNRWEPTDQHLHLPKSSPMIGIGQRNWRDIAKLKLGSGPTQDLFYTGIHAMSRGDFVNFQGMISEFLTKVQTIVEKSPPEDLVCLSIDLYSV